MFSFRVFLLWFMLFAVPFQGYAAGAMALCMPTSGPSMAHGEHDAGVSVQVDGHHAGVDAASAHSENGHDEAHAGDHMCSNCAACHSTGLTPAIDTLTIHGLPQADFAEPLYTLATRSPGVPDKPPRA